VTFALHKSFRRHYRTQKVKESSSLLLTTSNKVRFLRCDSKDSFALHEGTSVLKIGRGRDDGNNRYF